MNLCRILLLIFSFITTERSVARSPLISQQQDLKTGFIGEVITVKIQFQDVNLDSVSCKLCPSYFKNILLLKTGSRKVNSTIGKVIEQEIKFTASKEGKLVVGPLPILVFKTGKVDTVLLERIEVKFNPEKLTTSLHDIKPQESITLIEIFSPILLYTLGIIVLIFTGIEVLSKIKFYVSSNWNPSPRRIALQQLKFLELHLKQETLAVNIIPEKALEILIHYLQQVYHLSPKEQMENRVVQKQSESGFTYTAKITETEKSLIDSVFSKSTKVRFAPVLTDKGSHLVFLKEIEDCVKRCPMVS